MNRAKLTAYATQEFADAVKRGAAVQNSSISDFMISTMAKAFANTGNEVEHAAIMARLDSLQRQNGGIQKSLEALFEFNVLASRFFFCFAPMMPAADRVALNARGGERLHDLIDTVIKRLSAGRSIWREHFQPTFYPQQPQESPQSQKPSAPSTSAEEEK